MINSYKDIVRKEWTANCGSLRSWIQFWSFRSILSWRLEQLYVWCLACQSLIAIVFVLTSFRRHRCRAGEWSFLHKRSSQKRRHFFVTTSSQVLCVRRTIATWRPCHIPPPPWFVPIPLTFHTFPFLGRRRLMWSLTPEERAAERCLHVPEEGGDGNMSESHIWPERNPQISILSSANLGWSCHLSHRHSNGSCERLSVLCIHSIKSWGHVGGIKQTLEGIVWASNMGWWISVPICSSLCMRVFWVYSDRVSYGDGGGRSRLLKAEGTEGSIIPLTLCPVANCFRERAQAANMKIFW